MLLHGGKIMKRIAMAVMALAIGAAGLPAAMASDGGAFRQAAWTGEQATVQSVQYRPWDRRYDDRRYDDRGGRWQGSRTRRSTSARLMNDPVYQRVRSASSVRVNNYFDGSRYRTSGQTFSGNIVQILDVHPNGTYTVFFNGATYQAYARSYRGQLLLYVGSAPSSQGYGYELIIQ
jgi:hypothetical protein